MHALVGNPAAAWPRPSPAQADSPPPACQLVLATTIATVPRTPISLRKLQPLRLSGRTGIAVATNAWHSHHANPTSDYDSYALIPSAC